LPDVVRTVQRRGSTAVGKALSIDGVTLAPGQFVYFRVTQLNAAAAPDGSARSDRAWTAPVWMEE
jgi:hypothetical protein